MVDQKVEDVIGAFLAWVDKRDDALHKRLGPKLTEPFFQYVDLLREVIK